MRLQIQIHPKSKTVIDCRINSEVATLYPWGSGDIVSPFKIIYEDMEIGEEKEIFDGIVFKFDGGHFLQSILGVE